MLETSQLPPGEQDRVLGVSQASSTPEESLFLTTEKISIVRYV